MAYSSKVLEHYENPKNVGSFDKNEANVGTGLVGAPACGDVLRLQIKVSEAGIIEDARFKTYGCLTGNTLVNTRTKAVKIKELKIGNTVLAWNGEAIVDQKIKNIIKRSVEIKELLVITFQRESSRKGIQGSQFSLICTKNHIFWNADNTPIEAEDLVSGAELYEMTEHELRKLTNYRHRELTKLAASKRIKELNKVFNHSLLPQNQVDFVCADPEGRKIKSKIASEKNWQNPVYVEKWCAGMAEIDRSLPTSIEKKFMHLFEQYSIAARYSAGTVWIQSSTGPVSPDFIVPGKKKCIEIYTKTLPEFMQSRGDNSDFIKNRQAQLASAGYDSLFLSIEEIDQVLPTLQKVQNFIHNGMKVVSVEPIRHKNQLKGCDRTRNDKEAVIVYDLELEEGAHVFFTNRVASHNCGSAIASSSLVSEWIKGKTLDEAAQIKNQEIAQELALPPVKIHCSILAEDSIKAAIEDYRKKKEALAQKNIESAPPVLPS